MPASPEKDRLMAMAQRLKGGEPTEPPAKIKKVAAGMRKGQLRDFAARQAHRMPTPFRHR